MKTFLFYDIETSGLNKAFDQVLQFAAIRTDLNLKEISRYEINVKLNPDIIPTPGAVITHHIGVRKAQNGISEIDAIKQIHTILNTPGTISLGYNTLGFDDEFLRFSFYRNLLPSYTHQYANQCSRMDIYPMVLMYYLYDPSILEWPKKEGKLSLKLENLNQANSFFKGRAHDAMVDVEVTLALAERLHKNQDMWNYVCGYFNKQIDETRSRNLEGLMIYSKFGNEYAFQSPVIYLGNHRHYKNQQLWLRLDSDNLVEPDEQKIQNYKFIANKKIGEPGFILPMTPKYLQHLDSSRRSLMESNKKWLREHPEIFQKIANYHSEFKFPIYPDTDIEARLYLEGFQTQEDSFLCASFHKAPHHEKAAIVNKMKQPTLKGLATRILGRHFPNEMDSSQKEDFNSFLQKAFSQNEQECLIDFMGSKRMTPKKALDEIKILEQQNLTTEQIYLLNEFKNYLSTIILP